MHNKKSLLLGIALALVMLSLAACNSSKMSKFPTGRFINTNDQTKEYQYNEDKTWSYYLGGLMSAKGTYQVEGNLWIEQGTPECPFPGTYEWSFDGKNLSFKLSGEDNCTPRKEATDGQTFVISK